MAVATSPLSPIGCLSSRERECLSALAAGRVLKQIACELGLAEVTVHLYVATAKKKLGARTREHAVALGVASGVISPPNFPSRSID
ncbi:MAG TPA: hypothetical protein DEA50_02400, partial [Parvularcula sp.]|nr:hypothetical protein [Parvularcula sp.]